MPTLWVWMGSDQGFDLHKGLGLDTHLSSSSCDQLKVGKEDLGNESSY